MTEIAAIFAIGPNNVIGIGNQLPWYSKQDFYHFKTTTKGYPCIFGDKTFFNLPKYPLKNRLNIVVNPEYKEGGEIIFCSEFDTSIEPVIHRNTGTFMKMNSLESAIQLGMNYDKVFVCGGAGVYKYCLEKELVDTIYLTKIISPKLQDEVQKSPKNFVYFPIDINEMLAQGWKRVDFGYDDKELPEENEEITVQFQKWIKIKE